MNDESPDSIVESGALRESRPTTNVEVVSYDGGEEYLLNDIGVALRLLSEWER